LGLSQSLKPCAIPSFLQDFGWSWITNLLLSRLSACQERVGTWASAFGQRIIVPQLNSALGKGLSSSHRIVLLQHEELVSRQDLLPIGCRPSGAGPGTSTSKLIESLC